MNNFQAALEKLGIADFSERIWNSNSHGELFHIMDYINMAEQLPPECLPHFRDVFLAVVKWCEENWKRPESCFQHMPKLIFELE